MIVYVLIVPSSPVTVTSTVDVSFGLYFPVPVTIAFGSFASASISTSVTSAPTENVYVLVDESNAGLNVPCGSLVAVNDFNVASLLCLLILIV